MKLRKIFHIRTFCIVSIVLMIIGGIYIRGTRYALIEGEYKDVDLSECLVGTNEYEFVEGKFHVIGNDPWLLFDFTRMADEKISGLVIELDSKINLSNVQVFYGKKDANFSEGNSDTFSGKSKVIEINSRKALDGFLYLRLDIDTDFNIEKIKIMNDYKLIFSDRGYKYLCMILISLFISVLISLFNQVDIVRKSLWLKIRKILQQMIINRRVILKRIAIPVIIFVLVYLGEYIYHKWNGNNYINIYRVLIFSCILNIIIFAIIYRDICFQYMHIYYFILTMTIGTVTIITIPPALGMSWDDEAHYSRAAELSWGMKGLISCTDVEIMISYLGDIIQSEKIYNHEIRDEWKNGFNINAEEYPLLENEPMRGGKLGIWIPAYIPSAVGLIVGRGIGLSFTNTFMLGKWMNLLCYSILFTFSIKLLEHRGKLLAAVVGMIPTSLYLCCSYSYDWWVIGFVVLGYALRIKEVQIHNKIRVLQLIKILCIMIIGLLPKAVYFLLLFPIFFIGDNKDKNVWVKRIMVIGVMVVLMATFMLPRLLNGFGVGDTRGGTEVNATEQVKFILRNPLQYVGILVGFLKTYLSPDNAGGYLTYLGYWGNAGYWSLCLLIIGTVVVMDNSEKSGGGKNNAWRKQSLVAILSCFASIVLVATAFYIVFTPVAYNEVLGCQYRYLLPVIFPFLYFAGKININISDNIKRKVFLLSTSIMAFVFLHGLYYLRVSSF